MPSVVEGSRALVGNGRVISLVAVLLIAGWGGMAAASDEVKAGLATPSSLPEWWKDVQVRAPVSSPVALPEDPEWEDSLTACAMRYEAEGKGREAIKVLTYALSKCKTTLQRAFVLFQSALIYEVSLRDYPRANGLFSELRKLKIDDSAKQKEARAYARFGQARCLEKMGSAAEAKSAYETLLRDFPRLDVELLFRLGRLAEARDERSEAGRYYKECVRAAAARNAEGGDIYYGRFILMCKIALREMASGPVDLSKVGGGVYVGRAYGYNSMIGVRTEIRNGRICEVTVIDREDKRPFDAYTLIPQRIKQHQSLDVDAVTGATVTSEAIINAVKQALQGKAGKRQKKEP